VNSSQNAGVGSFRPVVPRMSTLSRVIGIALVRRIAFGSATRIRKVKFSVSRCPKVTCFDCLSHPDAKDHRCKKRRRLGYTLEHGRKFGARRLQLNGPQRTLRQF
jgi:hypothetical protein